ncbi:MAG: hypothetical protein C4342_08225, partial [Armatimonadota bacterium]
VDGTANNIVLTWAIDANNSLAISVPNAIVTGDPLVPDNSNKGLARIRLQFTGTSRGGSPVTVTLKNSNASY